MTCLDVEVIHGFADGRLGPEELNVVEAHARWCLPCQELLTAGVAAQSQAGPGVSEDKGGSPGTLGRGATVGRYTILALVGRGAMGEVYAAYDPELDRRIALKLLHEGDPFGESRATKRARLLREAKAIARLSHPNVVVVHDAGTVDDRVFIAMEFIAGQTLADLLRGGPRPWREVLDLFIAAGRGLSAAHDAGVVHRDFKPQNVMVAADGSVRVMDFGLASKPGPSEVGGSGAARSSLAGPADSPLTHTGALIGTPAYMAPEQFHTARADSPRSDQFSFCVALYEALYGERPFAGDTLQGLINSVTAGEVRPAPAGTRVPGWIRKILIRGLAFDPNRRYPSMAVLLAALRADPSSRRRRWLVAGVAIGAAIGVGAMGRQVVRHPGRMCEGGASHLAGVWDPGETAVLRQGIHRAFLATASPAAERAFAGVESLLDRYATDWTSMYKETCEATHVLGEQSAEVLDLRMDCLQKRLGNVRALTSVLSNANASVVDNAVQAASDLPSLTPCSDVKALRAILPPPENPEAHKRVDVLRAEVAELIALKDAGECRAAEVKAKRLIPAVREVGYMPLVAEALNGVALLANTCADPAVSGEMAREGYYAAIEAHDDRAATVAAMTLTVLACNRLSDLAAARHWARISRATLRRIGSDPVLEAWVLEAEGLTLHAQGLHTEAIEAERRAVELVQRLLGPEHVTTLIALQDLGNGLTETRRLGEGLDVTTRAMGGFEHVLGPQSTWVATLSSNRGETLNLLGRFTEARQAYQRALDIWRREEADPFLIAWGLTGLGIAYLGEQRPSDAVEPLEEAYRIRLEKHVGAEQLGEVRFALARALRAGGGDRARARGLATSARTDFAASGHQSTRSEVDAWLAARSGRARSTFSRITALR